MLLIQHIHSWTSLHVCFPNFTNNALKLNKVFSYIKLSLFVLGKYHLTSQVFSGLDEQIKKLQSLPSTLKSPSHKYDMDLV